MLLPCPNPPINKGEDDPAPEFDDEFICFDFEPNYNSLDDFRRGIFEAARDKYDKDYPFLLSIHNGYNDDVVELFSQLGWNDAMNLKINRMSIFFTSDSKYDGEGLGAYIQLAGGHMFHMDILDLNNLNETVLKFISL